MRKLICIILISGLHLQLVAQNVAINAAGSPAHPSAMLDVSSSSKGVLVPRMLTSERTAIASPAEGLLVFDTDTRSFWYFSGSWNEISSGGGGGQSGFAGGDLSGSYPTPNVVKIQNLDVAPGVPFDRQVLKWDQLNNSWKGMNDSLFLPYNASFGSASKLFGITNSNTSNGATAIYGRSGNTGSGIFPALSVGVWGDNTAGAGLLGTSSNGVGTYGYSMQNNGVYGFTTGSNAAGVYGNNAGAGYGIMGENFSQGIAVYGKANGVNGKAALFENLNPAGTDTVMKVKQAGTGTAGDFRIMNENNIQPVIGSSTNGTGHGIEVTLQNEQSYGQGVRVVHYGTGDGIFVAAKSGRAAFFANDNNNASAVAEIYNAGTGKGLQVGSISPSSNNPSISVSHAGIASALMVTMHNGSALSAAIQAHSSGQAGLSASALANNGIGIKGYTGANASGGIGVLGMAGSNDATGIGVKGVSSSPSKEQGAVTGINTAAGIGIYGESTGLDGVGVYGMAGVNSSHTLAGVFRNVNPSNLRNVVEISNNGTGHNLFIQNSNAANSSATMRLRNNGTGKFIQLEDGGGAVVTTIAKNGDVVTNGTLKVKTNKGIVRNTGTAQMRFEVVQAAVEALNGNYLILCANCMMERSFSFAEPFSAPPAVSLGNLLPNYGGFFPDHLNVSVESVTTTGFKLVIMNQLNAQLSFKGTWNVLAIGQE